MTKIEAIIRPESLDAVVDALEEVGHAGMNIADVRGHGRQKGMKELFRGREYENRFIPKIKIEVVVKDALAEHAIETIIAKARTGQIGDGKIFVSEVRDAIRVRTGERGDAAVLAGMKAALEELRFSARAGAALADDAGAVAALRAARSLFLFMLAKRSGALRWRPGRGRELARAVCAATDSLVLACAGRAGTLPRGAALIVTGGGGRGELAPFSDLDLLLAFGESPGPEGRDWASRLMRLLWDSGLVGNLSVRTWAECETDGGTDLQFLTSLASGRCILGDAEEAGHLGAGIVKRHREAGRRQFLEETAGAERAALGGEAALFSREPDLKNGPGGLRTLHRMEWLGILAGAAGGREAWRAGLGGRDLARVDAAYDFQLALRIGLHLRKGREVDRLLHDDIAALAGEGEAATARLSRSLVEARRSLRRIPGASDSSGLDRPPRQGGPAAHGASPFPSPGGRGLPDLPSGFRLQEGLVLPPAAADAATLGTDAVLAALLIVARGEAACSAALIDLASRVARSRRVGMASRPTFAAFREILNSPSSAAALAALDASGLLSSLVPPYAAVRDLVTSHSFHDLPVGPHSIRAVGFADSLLGPDRAVAQAFSVPLAEVAGRYIETGWIVKLALLLHDTGKAFEGDHAKNGAELSSGFLEGLPTEALIKDMVADLVENHLLLSSASRSFYGADPAALAGLEAEFALKPYPEDAAGLLSLLTACDMAATNPKAWGGYRASRLETLATALVAAVSGSGGGASPRHLLSERARRLDLIDKSGALGAFARRLGDRYTLANAPERIAGDYSLFGNNRYSRYDLVVSAENDHIRVKVVAPDEVGLFATLAGILLVNGADIVRADIHTLDGIAIDEFIVTEVFGNDYLAEAMSRELSLWIEDLRRSLLHYITRQGELAVGVLGLEKATKPVPRIFRRPATVRGTKEGGLCRFEVACTDRPALLYDLAHSLSLAKLSVQSALIETTGWRVHDSFVVSTDRVFDQDMVDRVAAGLLAVCEGGPG